MRCSVSVGVAFILLLGALSAEADDLAVLQAIKASYPKSSGIDDWTGSCTLTSCSWPGVALNNSRVIGLELYARTGVIPTTIGLLDALESLTFIGSSVTAPLPLEVFNLRSLTRLDYPVLRSGYTMPTQIGLLTNLVSVTFAQTGLYGILPTEIGLLTKLKTFNIFGNQVTGVIPTEIGNMKALELIHLGDNWQLTGSIPASFWTLSNLTEVIFTATNLIGTLPVELPQLQQLKRFSITYLGGINGSIPTEWGNIGMPNLATLNLGATSISGDIPLSFYSLTGLVSVSMENTRITGTISTLIGNLRALQDFTIMNTRLLAGTIPTAIGLINDLVTLQWSNANLTGPIPTELYKFNLSTIDLSGNSLTGTLPTEFAINMKPGRNGYPGNLILSNNPWTITTFPTEFAVLRNMWTLSLAGLDFGGAPLPPQFKDWSTREADLSNCNLTGTLPPLIAVSDRLYVSGNHFTGTIPSSYAYMRNLDVGGNPLSGTIPPEILLNPSMNLNVRGVALSNCTLPAGITPPANASCFDLCVPPPPGCVRAVVTFDACVSVCPRVGCALPPPTSDAFCDLGLWHIPGSFIQIGNLSISTSPIVVEGNYTANSDAITIVTLSGNAPGVPRINVTESAILDEGTTLVILIDTDVDAGTTIDVVVGPSVSGNYTRVVLDGRRAKCVRSTQTTTSAGISVLLSPSGCGGRSRVGLIVGVVLGVVVGLSVLTVVLLLVFRDRVPFFKHRRGRLRSSRRAEGVYDT